MSDQDDPSTIADRRVILRNEGLIRPFKGVCPARTLWESPLLGTLAIYTVTPVTPIAAL